jgi:hypothetical protein
MGTKDGGLVTLDFWLVWAALVRFFVDLSLASRAVRGEKERERRLYADEAVVYPITALWLSHPAPCPPLSFSLTRFLFVAVFGP